MSFARTAKKNGSRRTGRRGAGSLARRTTGAVAAASSLMLVFSGCAGGSAPGGTADSPVTITFTSIGSPGGAIQDGMDWLMDEIEERTDGAVEFERFYAGALVGAVDTLPAVADGRAGAGYLSPVYAPALLPLVNVSNVPGSGANTESHMQALRTMNEENAAFQSELESNNVKALVFAPVGALDIIIAPGPFESLSDLSGTRVRAAGPAATALEEIGVNPVALETQESYEAIERGTIDGVNGLPMDILPSFGLVEVAPWLTNLGLGTWGGGTFLINKDVWDSLPADVQAVIEEVSEDYYDEALRILTEREAIVCDELLAAGGGAVQVPAAESKKWSGDLGDSLWQIWRDSSRGSGVSESDIESVESQFRELNEEYAETATYVSGIENCVKSTSSE